MPKAGLSEIVVVVDRSGSMSAIKMDAIGGFNSFLQTQKELPGDAKFTLILFNHEYKIIHDGVPIKEVPNLNTKSYYPTGNTALYDAVGRAIDSVGERLANTPEEERPEKVIVAILTDGEENSSKEYKQAKINEMIKHQKEVYSWEFVFLAANIDAVETAKSIGIDVKDAFGFVATGMGVRSAYRGLSDTVGSYRTK
jgi:uncharacterized protein YegL